jgi:hypothetical protein
MLAVTILGIVATTIYGTFSRTLRSKGLAEERMDVMRTGRSAVERMGEELASAFYPAPAVPGAIFRSLKLGTEAVPLDAIVFSALSTRPVGAAGRDADQRIISYFFPDREGRMRGGERGSGGQTERGERGRGFGAPSDDEVEDFFAAFGREPARVPGLRTERLLRREVVMTGHEPDVGITPTAFLDDVASLELRFHDGTDWVEAWDSEDRANYRPLPRAVAIDLALYDRSGATHHFTTAVDLALADARPGPSRSGSPAANATPGRSPGVGSSFGAR